MAHVILEHAETIELQNPVANEAREDWIRRFPVPPGTRGPLRISADVQADRITGVPGTAATVFFNIEYAQGPIFWDTFLYPDTGSTPWRSLATEVRDRGEVRVIEMHIRMHAQGTLRVRNLRVESMEAWPPPPDLTVLIFGDSTDMTCYLPSEHRLGRRLELLLRDRFDRHCLEVHSLAEGGETIVRLVDTGRLERELAIMPRGDIVIIRYGLNDNSRGIAPSLFEDRLSRACDLVLARFPEAQIVLATTIPPHAEPYDQATQSVARARSLPLIRVDEMMRRRSAAGDSDWHHQRGSRFGRRRDENPPGMVTGLEGDKHPNAYGSQMLAELYFDSLEPLIARRLESERQA